MKTLSVVAAALALSSLIGCASAGEITDAPPPVPEMSVQTTLCNHPVYLGDGASVWYAWVEYTTLPLVIEVRASGETRLPYASNDEVLEHWIRDMGDVKRVIVQCATEEGAPSFKYKGFQDITFNAAF